MNNEYRNLILTAGLVIGIGNAMISYLDFFLDGIPGAGIVRYVLLLLLLTSGLIGYGKKAAAIKNIDGIGYTYGQAFGFSISVLALAGVILGIATWVLQTYIAPDFYEELYRQSLQAMTTLGDKEIEVMNMMFTMMKSVWFMMFASVVSMVISGGFIALFTSAVVRVKPEI